MDSSSNSHSKPGADGTNYEDFTFSTVIEVQTRKLSPTHCSYLRRVRRDFSNHGLVTGEPTGRLNKVSTAEVDGDIPHVELP